MWEREGWKRVFVFTVLCLHFVKSLLFTRARFCLVRDLTSKPLVPEKKTIYSTRVCVCFKRLVILKELFCFCFLSHFLKIIYAWLNYREILGLEIYIYRYKNICICMKYTYKTNRYWKEVEGIVSEGLEEKHICLKCHTFCPPLYISHSWSRSTVVYFDQCIQTIPFNSLLTHPPACGWMVLETN